MAYVVDRTNRVWGPKKICFKVININDSEVLCKKKLCTLNKLCTLKSIIINFVITIIIKCLYHSALALTKTIKQPATCTWCRFSRGQQSVPTSCFIWKVHICCVLYN
jgi:hypothetical protein